MGVVFILVLLSLTIAGAQAADEWPDKRVVGPLVCRADFPLSEIDGLLKDLQQLQADVSRDLALPPPGEWIELYLFHDKATYDRYLARQFPQVPYRRALYMKSDGQGRLLAYRGPQFEVDVRHECTHALLHAALPLVPLWLDEGLAKYYEVPRQKRGSANPPQDGMLGAIRPAASISLEYLEKKDKVQEMGRDEYRAAWAWTHFMLHGPREAREELLRYLGDLRAGRQPGPLSPRLRARMPDLDGQFARHGKGRSWFLAGRQDAP